MSDGSMSRVPWFTVVIVRCIRLGLPGFILWLMVPGRPLRLLLLLALSHLGVDPLLCGVVSPLWYVPIIR